MWELDCKESWAPKNWWFWTVVLEKTLESPLDCKESQPVHPKGDQSWVFIGRTNVEAETPILWPPDAKSWLIWRDPDAGKDWGQEEKGKTRGWDGWIASPTRWTWVWVDSGSWWWTGRPGMLGFMGLQRVRHDWATELNWTFSLALILAPFVLLDNSFPLSTSPLSSKGWSGMVGCISLMFQYVSMFKEHWMKNCGAVFRLTIKGSWIDWWCLPSIWTCCLLTWLVSVFLPYLVFSDYVSTTHHTCRKPV